MKKKEFAVGEVFQLGLKKLKVVKRSVSVTCNKCCFLDICEPNFFEDYLVPIVGHCDEYNRIDRDSVVFVEVEDEEWLKEQEGGDK